MGEQHVGWILVNCYGMEREMYIWVTARAFGVGRHSLTGEKAKLYTTSCTNKKVHVSREVPE